MRRKYRDGEVALFLAVVVSAVLLLYLIAGGILDEIKPTRGIREEPEAGVEAVPGVSPGGKSPQGGAGLP